MSTAQDSIKRLTLPLTLCFSGFKRYVKKSVTDFGEFLSSNDNSSGVGGHSGSGS